MTAQWAKVLLMSWAIPPSPTGSGVIVGNLVKQFSRGEMVALGANYVGSPGVEWRPEWPKLIYATIQPPAHWRGARWLRWAQWPWLLLRALWTLVTEHCEVILAVFPDEIYLLAAYVLSVVTRKPLFLYFHNTYLDNRRSSRLAPALQTRAFSRARHVFVMSEGMQRLYQVRYPGLPCSPLVHSFNEALPEFTPWPEVHFPLHLMLAGNVNASCADAAGRIAQAVTGLDDVQCTVLSGTPRRYLQQVGFAGPKFTVTTVSRDVLLEALHAADVLLLPHGFAGNIASEEIQTIFPTKTIEYLIAGRPILAHLPEDCFLAEFLRRHDCALLITEPDVQVLQAAIRHLQLDRRLREQLVRNALAAAKQFQAPLVAEHLRAVLTASLSSGAS